nr:hypothetical protein K-LCC10_0182 [Kaumoebavirus]
MEELIRQHIASDLSAAVDYLCSFSIKQYNNSATNSMMLVTGSKALHAYLETVYREDETDGWKVILYSDSPDIDDDVTQCGWYIAKYCNDLISSYMPILPLTVFTAIKRSYAKFARVHADTQPPQLEVITENKGDHLVVKLFSNGEYLIDMMQVYPEPCSESDLDRLFDLSNCDEYDPRHMLDDKRYYVSLVELKKYYDRTDIRDKNFSNDAERFRYHYASDTFICRTDDERCRNNVVYDCTGELPWFRSNMTLLPDHMDRDTLRAEENEEYQHVYEYTANSTINTPLLKSYYFDLPLTSVATEEQLKRIENLDNAFDKWDMMGVIEYEQPLLMYRLTRYVDPPRNGITDVERDPNLFNLKAGDIIPAICYTSTSYSNRMHAAAFDQESQFKGCVFVISASSSRGLIVIDEMSAYPEEKEILLDRRGFLQVTKIDYAYTTEECNDNIKFNERMVIYCDYLPRKISGGGNELAKKGSVLQELALLNPKAKLFNTNPQRNIPIFVDNHEFDQRRNKSRRCLNPFMRFSRNGLLGGDKLSTFPADGTAAMAITIFHMHHNSFKGYGTRCNTINGPIYLPIAVLESNQLPTKPVLAITGGADKVVDLDKIFPEETTPTAPVADMINVAAKLATVIKFDRNEFGLLNVLLLILVILLVIITAWAIYTYFEMDWAGKLFQLT